MTEVLNYFVVFLSINLVAITIQNAVFARALGVSRLLSLVDDTTSTGIFGLLLTLVTVLGTVGNFFLSKLLVTYTALYYYLQTLCIAVCISFAFLLVFILTLKLFPQRFVSRALDMLPGAAFNCLVFGTIMLTNTQSYDLYVSICYAIGSSLGFLLAVLLVTEGQRKLDNPELPNAFKGLPATLLYLAGLALAFYGLTGYSFSFN